MATPTGSTVDPKTQRIGIIRQNPADTGGNAFVAASSSTTNQWTNPGLANTNYRQVYVDAGSITVDDGVTVDEYNTTGQNSIFYEDGRHYYDSTTGLKRISYSMPVDKNNIAAHLAACCQYVSEAATTPYTKTISYNPSIEPIDYNGGGGRLFSVAYDQGGSADDGLLLTGAIIENMDLTFDLNNQGVARNLQANVTWVGNVLNYEQTLSGTWVSPTFAPYNDDDTFTPTSFDINSVDYSGECIRRVMISMRNNIEVSCRGTAGKPDQYRRRKPEQTISILVDYNSTTEKIQQQYKTGNDAYFVFDNDIAGGSGNDGYFAIATSTYSKIIEPARGFESSDVTVPITIRCYSNTSGGVPLQFTVDDALDWTF